MSLLGNTARVKSKGNFTKATRDRTVEISEDHHGCIKTLHFGNQGGGYFAEKLWRKGFGAVGGPRQRFCETSKESPVFAKVPQHF